MTFVPDIEIDRRNSDSIKWNLYDKDVIPMWVADTDFMAPGPVVNALLERARHGVFGYNYDPPELKKIIVERLKRLYDWDVHSEEIIYLPGVVTGYNLACHAFTSPGDGVIFQTPVYYPILDVPKNCSIVSNEMELTGSSNGYYTIDMGKFKSQINDRTRVFILCNPHNPVGRVYSKEELIKMAEICLKNDVIICSDEIHCDLIFSGEQHIPIASIDPEIADKTITLMAPSKTFNIAGLQHSFAVIQNKDLMQQYISAKAGLVPRVSITGCTAALSAYKEGEPWLREMLTYLEQNRNYLKQYIDKNLPELTVSLPEGTYLAWIDCRNANIPGNPQTFFLENARVALNDGSPFGKGGKGFVRLNFGCRMSVLQKALERMLKACKSL